MPARTVLLLILVNLLWALNVVVSKVAVGDLGMPPIFYAALRALLTIIVLARLLRPLPAQPALQLLRLLHRLRQPHLCAKPGTREFSMVQR